MRTSIDQVLQAAVDSGAVPNVAAIAADANGVIYRGAAGPQQVGGTESVSVNTGFRIMSMTKLVVTAAALQLVEQGKLDLAAPVQEYLPEFAKRQVLVGFDGETPQLRPPETRVTVKHLVTHTSGLGYPFFNAELARWEQATGTPPLVAGLKTALGAPMVVDPGTRFNYGINTDWLGLVIEATVGKPLDVAIKDGITGPLGMPNTTFSPNSTQRANTTPVYVKGEDGQWVALDELLPTQPEWWAGGNGLYSTPTDYIRFEQALLRGGELDGQRILSPDTVEAAFTNQIGELDLPAAMLTADPTLTRDLPIGTDHKWGYGVALNSREVPGMRQAWSGTWAGLLNTYFWIDRTSGVCASIYSNFLPLAEPGALELYVNFEKALYALHS